MSARAPLGTYIGASRIGHIMTVPRSLTFAPSLTVCIRKSSRQVPGAHSHRAELCAAFDGAAAEENATCTGFTLDGWLKERRRAVFS